MQLSTLTLCLALMAATYLVTREVARPVPAQDPAKEAGGQDMQEMMKEYMKAAQPGKPHEGLVALVGKWDMETEMHMGMPEPQKSKGSCEFKSILGGRFVVQTSQGQMMGMPFESFQVLGYDNVAKKYVAVWMDSMSTGIHDSTGTADEAGKTIKLAGMMKDAMSPEGRPFRVTIEHKSKDEFLVEVYDTMPDGKEFLVLKSRNTRK